MPRYVILLHEIPPGHKVAGGRGTHWDLMLEQNGVLRTWALADEPRGELTTQAEQLPDHRLAYLDYEGPVSGNRGNVSQWDAGEYEVLAESAERLELRLVDSSAARYVSLTADAGRDGHFWSASFSLAPIRGSSSPGPSRPDSSSSSS